MGRSFITLVTAAMLVGSLGLARAEDGHGNAANPERAVPNTGGVSGGPVHRDEPRQMEADKAAAKDKVGHTAGDGHAHGKK